MGDDNSLVGDVIGSIAPYLFLALVAYLGIRWISNTNPLEGVVPDLGQLNPFAQQRQNRTKEEGPGQQITRELSTGKRLEEQVDRERFELQQEETGRDLRTFEERDIAEEVRTERPEASEEQVREEIAERRARLRQRRKATDQIVEGLESGRFTAGTEERDQELIRDFRESQELHQLTVKEQKEMRQERRGFDKETKKEKRIRQQTFQEARQAIPGDEPLTDRQRRILEHAAAINRAEAEQEQKKERQQGQQQKRTEPVDMIAEAGKQAAVTAAKATPFGMLAQAGVEAGQQLASDKQQDRKKDADVLGFDVPFV